MPRFFGNLSAISRANDFEDLYYEQSILVCRFCLTSLDTKVSTIKDHLESKIIGRKKGKKRKKKPRKHQRSLKAAYCSLNQRTLTSKQNLWQNYVPKIAEQN